MNDFLDTPTTTGWPSATIRSRFRRSARLCSRVFPNPTPGSTAMASVAAPAASRARIRSTRKEETSPRTSSYWGWVCIVFGLPSMCITTAPARLPATTCTMAASLIPESSFTIEAPASIAFAATSGFIVATDKGMSTLFARSCITGQIRRHSSVAVTEPAPGRVDSPPTSSRPAPCSTISGPGRKAAAASKRHGRIEEALVCFISAEKRDEANPASTARAAAATVADVAGQLHTKRTVLYPYAHLSSSLAAPGPAQELMASLEKELVARGFDVHASPFGYYKSFRGAVKGHPLSEVYRGIVA